MPAPTGNWARATAHRLGLGGQIEFTVAAVGQTLHVHCKKGAHVVDVPIAARQHPDAIAKKMLHDGWVIGSKLTCPDCARQVKEVRVEKARATGNKLRGKGSGWAQKLVEARRAKYTPEQLSEISRQAGKMSTGVMPKGKVELKQENPPMVSQKAIEMSGAALPVIATAGSEGAKRAHRMVMMALEDYYDESRKCYKPGQSDKTIADSTGSSEAHVRETREGFFGPLGEHPELAELRARLGKFNEGIASINETYNRAIKDLEKEADAIKARMERVCIKNGWPVQ